MSLRGQVGLTSMVQIDPLRVVLAVAAWSPLFPATLAPHPCGSNGRARSAVSQNYPFHHAHRQYTAQDFLRMYGKVTRVFLDDQIAIISSATSKEASWGNVPDDTYTIYGRVVCLGNAVVLSSDTEEANLTSIEPSGMLSDNVRGVNYHRRPFALGRSGFGVCPVQDLCRTVLLDRKITLKRALSQTHIVPMPSMQDANWAVAHAHAQADASASAVLYFMIGAPLAFVCALMLVVVWEQFKLTLHSQ
ncbi:hypothetical protein B0H19DRAFT_1381529 [Mycena capillaripes]|nr:hypothetical protein B0H19DRAFT_1381529 [Mycena capillaripes]